MTHEMQRRIEEWDGLAVVCRYDRGAAAWVFVALHDDTLGTPTGGTRMRVYARPEDGLDDALRLAEGMTRKWAAIELGFGGGKAVLALSRPLDAGERTGLLRRYGKLLESLRGAFSTGEDLGTTPEDMLLVASETRHVHGCDPASGSAKDPGPYTALGVLEAMRATVRQRFGGDLAGRLVVIQGVGDVGAPLAKLCAEAGARVAVADLDGERAARVAREVGGATIDAAEALRVDCDVLAPCAVGQVLNRRTIPGLGCRVVAGSANNQLEGPDDAERLHDRGILYAPDYVANAGGALAFGLMSLGEADEDVLRERVRGLGGTVAEILAEATEGGESPIHAAERRVNRVLGRP